LTLSKEQSRQRWGQSRDLACEWDPIGVVSDNMNRDEYDCLLGPLLRLLEDKASTDEIFMYLDDEMKGHFGLPYVPTTRAFANKVKSWYENTWPNSSVQNGMRE